MKYKKPYFDDTKSFDGLPPTPIITKGLVTFFVMFQKEITDIDSWKRQPALSQLIIHRVSWLFWHKEEVEEIKKRARPFIALMNESYTKDPQKTIQIYCEIMDSYNEVQHSAYVRDSEIPETDDHVKKFQHVFDEYRFRYEQILNRLVSIAYGCIEVLDDKPPKDGAACISKDMNPKIEKLNETDLPKNKDYEKIKITIDDIKTGIRNAISHGGNIEPIKDTEKFLLKDKSGWSKEYTLEELRFELDTLNRIILSMEFGALVINMNYLSEIAKQQKDSIRNLSQEEKSHLLYLAGKDCELEIIEAEDKTPVFEMKLRFNPIQPRESEVFGNLGNGYFSQKIPARLVDLKGQTLRFLHLVIALFSDSTPSASITIYTYGDKKLASLTMNDVRNFDKDATAELKSYDDHATKKKLEEKYLKWERFEWGDGEIKEE